MYAGLNGAKKRIDKFPLTLRVRILRDLRANVDRNF
jgi:hypothetical protein